MAYPFHISRSRVTGEEATSNSVDMTATVYGDRFIKLIPSEILGLYLAVRGIWIDPQPPQSPITRNDASLGFLDWWPIVCILLLVLLRLWGTRRTRVWSTTDPVAVIISVVSFIIWVYTIGDSILGQNLPDTRYAATAAIIWSVVIPIFFPYLITEAINPVK